MKTMKKLFALTLAMMMVFSLALSANAMDVTIQNAQVSQIYNVYKLLDEHTQTDDGIVYKTTVAWKDFWSQKAISVGDTTVNITEYFTSKTEGTSQIVIPTAAFNESSAAIVAKAAAQYATVNSIAAVGTAIGAETTSISLTTGDGYYLMTSTTGALCTLAHIEENGNLVLREKNTPSELPSVNKTITDPEGTVYNVGDTVNFQIVIECEENAVEYVLHDVMNGMTLNNDVAVTYDGSATMGWEVLNQDLTDTCTFEIKIIFTGAVKAYDKVTITYSTTVNEDSVEGMSNSATLEGVTDDVEVTKESFKLKKTDGTNVLGGAEFELYYIQPSEVEGQEPIYVNVPVVKVGDYYRPAGDNETGVQIVAGEVTIKGLEEGVVYYVKETKAPEGYIPINDYMPVENGTVTVVNVKGDELPETGGMGTTLFYALGGLMVAAAAVMLITKKRMSAM